MDWQAIWLSVRLAASTTAILLVLGLPVAYWLTFSPRRWKFLAEALVALPLVLPPTVLGFYVLLAIGPRSPLGALYSRLTGGMLPFSFQGLLLASVLYSFPFTVQPVAAAFAGVDRKLLEASWCLGVSRAATFRRVIVPLSLRGIATGAILSFAHTLGEFGVVLMVGGNIAGVTRTVSISIYDSVQALDYAAAVGDVAVSALRLLRRAGTHLRAAAAHLGGMADQLICQCRKRLSRGFEVEADLRIPLDRAPVAVLFGPSGSGKTTLLRMLAGLERPDAGSIVFREIAPGSTPRAAFTLPPQSAAPDSCFRTTRCSRISRWRRMSATRRLARPPASCSTHSGWRTLPPANPARFRAGSSSGLPWRARWLPNPRYCCWMNRSPRWMRRRARACATNCGGCCSPSGVPSIVVTHDRMEAVALGDWMAVIVDGRIRQTGPVQEVFRRPADLQVAESVGVENVLAAEIVGREAGLLVLQVRRRARIQCVDSGETGPVFACIRAEDVAITRQTDQVSSARNRLAGRVRAVIPEGALARVELDCGFPLVAMVTAQSAARTGAARGRDVSAVVKTTSVHLAAHSSLQ